MTTPAPTITLHQPRTLVFGAGCIDRAADTIVARDLNRVFIVSSPSTSRHGQPLYEKLKSSGRDAIVYDRINREPTFDDFRTTLTAARDARADAVIGLGGGSPLDVAKIVAALLRSNQDLRDILGIGKLASRSTYLACLPTTAGTGSEVSPNAVLLDEDDLLKKAAISPHLVPDAAYIDPTLTITVPPAVTAATGIDALTHCIEAVANKFAHPMADLYALEGIRVIASNLARCVENGNDIEARTAVARGSLYGGICLGPVNTAAVHALAYPLGGEFHVAHGVSNSVLLPHVLEFNLSAAPERYAMIAVALGAERAADDTTTAKRGLEIVRDLSRRCGIPEHITDLGVPADAIDRMAGAAMKVTRLLDRNVRTVTLNDAIDIYRRAL